MAIVLQKLQENIAVLNPDYALEFERWATNTIKTNIWADFLLAIIVNYGNNEKSSKYSCLKYLEFVIEFLLRNQG